MVSSYLRPEALPQKLDLRSLTRKRRAKALPHEQSAAGAPLAPTFEPVTGKALLDTEGMKTPPLPSVQPAVYRMFPQRAKY
jgi:hypothetical protein